MNRFICIVYYPHFLDWGSGQMQHEAITVVIAYKEPDKIIHNLIKLCLFIPVVSIMHMENSADVKKVITAT